MPLRINLDAISGPHSRVRALNTWFHLCLWFANFWLQAAKTLQSTTVVEQLTLNLLGGDILEPHIIPTGDL